MLKNTGIFNYKIFINSSFMTAEFRNPEFQIDVFVDNLNIFINILQMLLSNII